MSEVNAITGRVAYEVHAGASFHYNQVQSGKDLSVGKLGN